MRKGTAYGLGKGAIQVDVAAVDEDVLSGGMTGERGEQKDGHAGDFGGLGEALSEGNLRCDGVQFLSRVRKS